MEAHAWHALLLDSGWHEGNTWRSVRPAAPRLKSGEESWRMGETDVFLSGAGLMPGGVAGTWRVEGGDPNCKKQSTQVRHKMWRAQCP